MTIVRFSRAAGQQREGVFASSRGHAREWNRTTASLPAEIAFLIGAGIAPALLFEAVRLARRAGVSADVALLAGGQVAESTFYRALAKRLGTAFLEHPVVIASSTLPELVVQAGIAALLPNDRGFTHVVAPRGPAIAALLAARRPRSSGEQPFLVATPRQFEALVRAAHAAQIAGEASRALPNRNAELSSLSRLTLAQIHALVVASCAAGFTLGTRPCLVGLAAGAVFLLAILVRLAAAAASRPMRPAAATHRLADASLPVYTVLVPLYREARMTRSLVQALDRLDYPAARLDIILLVENGDEATRDALVALALPTRYRIMTVPPGCPQTKPRALNVGLKFARGSLLVVFDAEDEPDPNQLRAAVAHFSNSPERVACLQAKLAIRDTCDGLVAKLFALEYCALFDVVNSGLAALRLPILLGGTSNHFRVAALRRLIGWDAWNVTEDADLGVRLARFGYDVAMLDSTTFEEAPHGWAAWLKQRTRWLKGYMQTFAVHSRAPGRFVKDVGMVRAVSCFSLLAGPILGALFGPIFMAAMGLQVWSGTPSGGASGVEIAAAALAGTVFALGLASAVWPVLLGRMRRPWLRLWPGMLALPLYWLLLSAAAWLALFELARWPFRWAKTEHGLGESARLREERARASTGLRDEIGAPANDAGTPPFSRSLSIAAPS